MRPVNLKLNEAQQQWVRNWWRALQPRADGDDPLPQELIAMGRGQRAQLRRCADVEELLVHSATLLLADRLIALNGTNGAVPDDARSFERIAWIAGVLAQVKNDNHDNKSLAFHLGAGALKDIKERQRMSELRFKSMLRSSSLPDLFTHWRRAVQLADNKADVARLADDILSWQIEMAGAYSRASQGVKFQWASDYYLTARERKDIEESNINKEIVQ
jgi:CRISPR system Cascade subunit CasB